MPPVVNPELQVARLISQLPAAGIVAALDGAGAVVNIIAWDPVTGDVAYSAPVGTAGGGGTRRHLFDRPVVSTAAMTATAFNGALVGNANTATALQTPRNINGVAFDGTANITVAAAAGTLTGGTLAAGVLASSLTSVGILASPHVTSLVVDSGGLTVTAGGITITAGTLSTQAISATSLTATTGTFSGAIVVATASGTAATLTLDRGALTDANYISWKTAGTEAWRAGRAASGTTWTLRDVVNGVDAISITPGSPPTLAFGATVSFTDLFAAATGEIGWTGRATIKSPSDGIITLYNDALSDFTRLTFGGTSASFPALQRSGAALEVRLADGSDLASLNVGALFAYGNIGLQGSTSVIGTDSGSFTAGAGTTNTTIFSLTSLQCWEIFAFSPDGNNVAMFALVWKDGITLRKSIIGPNLDIVFSGSNVQIQSNAAQTIHWVATRRVV